MTSPTNERPVDEFDLELELAGEDLGPDRSAQVRQERSLDPARADIERTRVWWTRHAPPLALPTPRVRRRWTWLAVPLALAAGLAFVVLNVGTQTQHAARGTMHVDLQALRGGVPVDRADGLYGGDELAIGLVPEDDRYVTVSTLQDNGAVSLLMVGESAAPSRPFRPDAHIALDGYSGREWLVVWTTTHRPTDVTTLIADHRALLPDPIAAAAERDDIEVIEITRSGSP